MHCYTPGLGWSPVARHYWGNHCCFLLLEVLRCFSSLRSPLYFCRDNSPSDYWVVPFGNLRVKGHLHLTGAYRSLSRPSSPPWAKASAMRPLLLSPMNWNWDIEAMRQWEINFSFSHFLILYISNSLILSAVDSYNLIYSLACVNMSKISWNWDIKRMRQWERNSSFSHFLIFYISSVENNGFEPLTPCLQSRCSSQLS